MKSYALTALAAIAVAFAGTRNTQAQNESQDGWTPREQCGQGQKTVICRLEAPIHQLMESLPGYASGDKPAVFDYGTSEGPDDGANVFFGAKEIFYCGSIQDYYRDQKRCFQIPYDDFAGAHFVRASDGSSFYLVDKDALMQMSDQDRANPLAALAKIAVSKQDFGTAYEDAHDEIWQDAADARQKKQAQADARAEAARNAAASATLECIRTGGCF